MTQKEKLEKFRDNLNQTKCAELIELINILLETLELPEDKEES